MRKYFNSFNPYTLIVHLWDIYEQCRPRSDVGSPIFAYRVLYYNLNKIEKIPSDNPKFEYKFIQSIKMGNPLGINGLMILVLIACVSSEGSDEYISIGTASANFSLLLEIFSLLRVTFSILREIFSLTRETFSL